MTSTQSTRPASRRNRDRTWTFDVTAVTGDGATVTVGQVLSDGCGRFAGMAAWARLADRVATRVVPGTDRLRTSVTDEGRTVLVTSRDGATHVLLHVEEVNVL